MPKNKIVSKNHLDKFYTNITTAKFCISLTIPYLHNKTIIEPSAGNGAFFFQLQQMGYNVIGLDICPEADGIIKMDWFDYNLPSNSFVIGNPPFGSRNNLSKKFIKKAAEYSDGIGFILPSIYRKEINQKVFPENWSLVSDTNLEYNSFTLNDQPYHMPCVYQIWIKNGQTNIRESIKSKITTNDWEFCHKDKADFFVFGAAPDKTLDLSCIKSTNRGYYIRELTNGVRQRFQQINWKLFGLSAVSGGVSWFTKQQLINIYEETKNAT